MTEGWRPLIPEYLFDKDNPPASNVHSVVCTGSAGKPRGHVKQLRVVDWKWTDFGGGIRCWSPMTRILKDWQKIGKLPQKIKDGSRYLSVSEKETDIYCPQCRRELLTQDK